LASDNEIKHEIMHILENGPVRSKELVNEVMKIDVSGKTVHRVILDMCESKVIRRIWHSRANIEYESVDPDRDFHHQMISHQLNAIDKRLNNFLNNFNKMIQNDNQIKLSYLNRLITIVSAIKELQNIESILRILSIYQPDERASHLAQFAKQVENIWKLIHDLIILQPDEIFLKELLMNFKHTTIGEATTI